MMHPSATVAVVAAAALLLLAADVAADEVETTKEAAAKEATAKEAKGAIIDRFVLAPDNLCVGLFTGLPRRLKNYHELRSCPPVPQLRPSVWNVPSELEMDLLA